MSDINVHLVHGRHTRSIKVSIGDRCQVVNSEVNYPELKHTIWWKGLFVSDFYILSDTFVINMRKNNSLRPTSINPDYLVKNVSNKDCIIFENEEVLNRAQIDEVKELLESYTNQKVTCVELELHVLKLLYCYILPTFMFGRTDLEWLRGCLKFIEDQLQKVDVDLIKDDKHVVKFESKLCDKRAEFCLLPEGQKESMLKTCDEKFSNTILSHFRKDCQSLEEVYSKRRGRVQNLKERLKKESMMMTQDEEQNESKTEQDLHFEREESHRISEKLFSLKMTIANIEFLKEHFNTSHTRKNLFSLPDTYIQLHELRVGLKKKVEEACIDKLRLKSITEGIKRAIQEVETFGESFGMESTHKEELKSFDPSNELDPACWQNCAEKVKSLLRDPDQKLSQLHHCFKDELRLKISFIISEQTLFQKSSDIETNEKYPSDCISSDKSEESTRFDELDILNPFSDVWVGIMQQLKERIHEQMTDMCQLMKTDLMLRKSERNEISKIYGNILLSDVMNDMCRLFEIALETYCKDLYSRISSLSFRDLMANTVYLDEEEKDSDETKIRSSTLKCFKESIRRINRSFSVELNSISDSSEEISRISRSFRESTRSELNSMSGSSKKISRNFTSRERSRSDCWNRSSMKDPVSSAFLRGSVSSLYKEADVEHLVHCKEEARPSSSEILQPEERDAKTEESILFENEETFLKSFRPSLLCIEKFFSLKTFQGKLDCIVRTLKCVSYSVVNIEDRLVTADDLICILSGLLHSLSEKQLKRLCLELVLINTFMSTDEKMGLQGNAIIHFLCAFEALSSMKNSKTDTL